MKNKINKVIMIAFVVCICFLGVADVSAKTLAQSFSGGTSVKRYNSGYQKETAIKTCYAQTKGYTNRKQYHHVLAYIGGTRNSTKGCVAQTRKYGYGDIRAEAKQKVTCTIGCSWNYLKTGYAKYGMGR